MNFSPRAVTLIKTFEGLRLKAYDDGGGVTTIGYGSTRGVKLGTIITPEVADAMLLRDLAAVAAGLNRMVTVALTQNQFDSLCSFVYNVGSGAFEKSQLLTLINEGRLNQASLELGRWCHDGGRVVAGLARRRAAERALFDSLR